MFCKVLFVSFNFYRQFIFSIVANMAASKTASASAALAEAREEKKKRKLVESKQNQSNSKMRWSGDDGTGSYKLDSIFSCIFPFDICEHLSALVLPMI